MALEDIGVRATIEGLSQFKQGVEQMDSGVRGLGQRLQDASRSFKVAGAALSAFAAGGIITIKKLTSAYLEQERALQTLGVAVATTGVSFADVKQEVLDITAALQRKTNYGDEEQIRALQELVFLSGSYENSIAALPAVLDLATGLSIDLGGAVNLVGRGLAGNTELFTRYGLTIEKGIAPLELITLLTEKFGGAAEANIDPWKQLGNTVGDFSETLGRALMPAVTFITNKLKSLFEWLQKLNPTLLEIGGTIFVVATAFAAIAGPILLFIGFIPQILAGIRAMIVGFSILKALLTGGVGIAQVAAALAVGAGVAYGLHKLLSPPTEGAITGPGSFQGGGTIGSTGMALVGERGAEFIKLPAATQVTPINRSTSYNVTANYSNPQVPQSIRLDLEALAMMARR